MEIWAFIFFFGLAAATSFQDVWEREKDKTVFEFTKGMKMAGPLRVAMGMPEVFELDEVEHDIKTELGKALREALDHIMKKINEAVDKGKEVHNNLIEKAKKIVEHLKKLHISIGDKAKKFIERVKEKAKDWLRKLLDKLKVEKRRSIQHTMEAAEEINLKDIMDKVLEMLKERIDVNKIKAYLKGKSEKIGEMVKIILEHFKEGKGRETILDLIEKLINRKEKETRSLKESWEELKQRLKDFFKDKHLKFKEKFSAFYEWLIDSVRNGLEVTKDKIQALKNIAREIIKYSKEVRKEVAIEALEALKPYKEELGDVWEKFKKIVIEILHRED